MNTYLVPTTAAYCYEPMSYFQVNWNKYTEQLSQKADYENWSNKTYPNKGILANYIVKTHDKLTSDKKITIGHDYALFKWCIRFNEKESIC